MNTREIGPGRTIVVLAVLLVATGMVGCGGAGTGDALDATDAHAEGLATDGAADLSDATPPDDATPPETIADQVDAWPTGTSVLDDYCRPWAAWTCARVLACGCGTPSGDAPSDQACLAAALAECQSATLAMRQAVEAGQAVVSLPDVQACMDALAVAAGPCGSASESSAGPACARQFATVEALGQACTASPCAGGRGACVEGTCQPLSGEGGPCAYRAHCQTGDCIEGTCQTPVAEGSTCGNPSPACAAPAVCVGTTCVAPVEAGGACEVDAECVAPLACLGGSCGAFPDAQCTTGAPCGNGGLCLGALDVRCEALGGGGAPCVGDAGCQPGFDCLDATCTPSPGLDEPCANGVGCAPGLACRFEGEQAGTCGPLPEKGDPCALGLYGPFVCGPGLACMADLFVCNDPPVGGEPCANPNLCAQDDFNSDGKAPDIACDFTEDGSVCVLRKGAGEPCQNDQVCADGLYCDYHVGACASTYPQGTFCSVGNECAAGTVCIPDAAGILACRPLPAIGDTCLFDCQAGAWCHARASDVRCQPPVCQLMYQLH